MTFFSKILKFSNSKRASNTYIAQLIPHVSFKNRSFCSTSRITEKQCKLRNVYNLKITMKRKARAKVRFSKTTTAGKRIQQLVLLLRSQYH